MLGLVHFYEYLYKTEKELPRLYKEHEKNEISNGEISNQGSIDNDEVSQGSNTNPISK